MPFAQIVVGPPGSGKTTYCNGMQQLMNAIGRKMIIVNLDPANDFIPYDCAVNIYELIQLDNVMKELELGPNGGMLYCLQYLTKNIDWLFSRLDNFEDFYIIFDCPGQVELYTHDDSVTTIIKYLQQKDYRLAAVHLVDAHHCTDPAKYISVLLTSLKTMLHLELPHINVLSKIDLVEAYGRLAYNLDFYTEVQEPSFLLDWINSDSFGKKYIKLNEALCELIQSYGLVGFYTLSVEDKESITELLRVIDKANGYVFGGLERSNTTIMEVADCSGINHLSDIRSVQEKYMQDLNDEDFAD